LDVQRELGLRLEQCLLRLLAPGDVLDDAGEAAPTGRECADALVATHGVRVSLELDRRLRVHDPHEFRQILGNGGREKRADAPANDLIAGDAGMLLIGIIHFEHPPIRRVALRVIEQLVKREAFRHVLEEQPVLLLACGQRLLRADSLGYVKCINTHDAGCRDHMDRLGEDRAAHPHLALETRLFLVVQLPQDSLEIVGKEGARIA